MLLILLSWIYIFFISANFGFAACRTMHIADQNIIIKCVVGLFVITIFASSWAFFGNIGLGFHIFLLTLNIILFLSWRKEITAAYFNMGLKLRRLPRAIQLLAVTITILIVAQCAAAPYIVDNESYYIQTIKWLNVYGFVPGLANLHIFYGQMSAWHLTQSALNFSFIYSNFNDLSGFCLLLGNMYALLRLGEYFKSHHKSDLIIGIFPIANVLLFQFIGAPSPDIPIYILTLIIAGIVLQKAKPTSAQFVLVFMLTLFAVFIKTTAVALFVIAIIIFMRDAKLFIPVIPKLAVLSIVILGLFVAKNLVISGLILFPTPVGHDLFQFAHKVPWQLIDFYYSETRYFAYKLTEAQFENLSVPALFKHWITMSNLHGFFNMLSIFLLVLSPLVIVRYLNNSRYWILYAAMAVQLILLAVSSPQYRFFLNFILIFSFIWFSVIIKNRSIILSVMFSACAVCAAILLLPMNFGTLTKNQHAMTNSQFQLENIIYPHHNSKLKTDFENLQIGNLQYHSPVSNQFLFGSGDGPLPCVNKDQIDYFESKFGYRPQMMGDKFSAGFVSENTAD